MSAESDTNEKLENSESQEVQKPEEKLSLRDALEVAYEGTKTPEPVAKEEPKEEVEAPREEVKLQAYQPPGEWNKEEREDFFQATPKQQEAILRLHKSRQSKLEEIKRESAELEWSRDLVKELEPFVKAHGEKGPANKLLIKALKAFNELESNPKGGVAAFLKAKGIEPPKELFVNESADIADSPKIRELQEKLESVTNRLASEDNQRFVQTLGQSWKDFSSAKNADGSPKFPESLDNSDAGLRLASNIGSLVTGKHEASNGFFAYVKNRFPDHDNTKLIEEAYKWFGGKVAETSSPSRTQDTQKHIALSSRAAASVPGRGISQGDGQPKKFKDYRSAAAAALEQLKEGV